MSSELDMEYVRKLHLELNGSGRRTRGPAPPPAKRLKRENSRPVSEGVKDERSASLSGSGSGKVRQTGGLKRLVKKQPDSESSQQHMAEEQGTTGEARPTKEALEPQASTKDTPAADEGGRRGGGGSGRGGGDIASQTTADLVNGDAFSLAGDTAARLARAAASRESSAASNRVKCFYVGYPYGLSFEQQTCSSRDTLADALRQALSAEYSVCPAAELEMFAYDKEGNQAVCGCEDSNSRWSSAVKNAKRIYVSGPAAQPTV